MEFSFPGDRVVSKVVKDATTFFSTSELTKPFQAGWGNSPVGRRRSSRASHAWVALTDKGVTTIWVKDTQRPAAVWSCLGRLPCANDCFKLEEPSEASSGEFSTRIEMFSVWLWTAQPEGALVAKEFALDAHKLHKPGKTRELAKAPEDLQKLLTRLIKCIASGKHSQAAGKVSIKPSRTMFLFSSF